MEWLIIIGIIYFGSIIWNSIKQNKSFKQKTSYNSSTSVQITKPRINLQGLDISNISLSQEQQKIFEKLENSKNHFFITGKAGTGKSVLLQYFKQKSSKKVIVCAPTGVAALNVGGQTIHSLLRIPPGFVDCDKLKPLGYKASLLLRNIDTFVIDEISMVRADLMDAVDYRLKQARSNNLPFGGIQIVMFGDMYQLPPIIDDPELHKYFAENYGGYYFFHGHSWLNTAFKIYELINIFRQKDELFIEVLNSIRKGQFVDRHLSILNKRSGITMPEEGVLTLATTNQDVNEINTYHLNKLPGKIYEYRATIIGDLEYSSFPTEVILRLKVGAQVMLLKNDKEKRWVNGTIGYIKSLSDLEIKVNIDGFIYSVPRETWNKIRYYYNQEKRKIEEEVISSFTQYPLRLAWAITIHKSQGHTYGSIAVDMGDGAFAFGQSYVALSRCKSLEGLYLKREIISKDIIVDPTIINFMSKLENQND